MIVIMLIMLAVIVKMMMMYIHAICCHPKEIIKVQSRRLDSSSNLLA